MRVLYVLDGFPVASETFIRREMEELQRRGVLCGVFALRRGDGELSGVPFDVVYSPRKASFRWSCLAAAVSCGMDADCTRMLKRMRLGGAVEELVKTLDRMRADVIHAHFLGVPSTVAMLASLSCGVPFTVSAHANDLFVSGEFVGIKGALASAVFACWEGGMRRLFSLGVPWRKVHLVHHGVEAVVASPRRRGGWPFRVGALGRFVPKKGLEYLFFAVSELRRRGCEVYCRVGGDGPLGNRLGEIVRLLGLGSCVEFAGWVGDVFAFLETVDVLVVPSVPDVRGDVDGIPNVVIEAMATAVPVVGTDVGGIPEVVRDGESGLLVPPADSYALADALHRLMEDDGLYAALSKRGLRLVREEFLASGGVSRMEEIWRGLIPPATR